MLVHLHGGLSYDKLGQIGLHYLNALSKDDRAEVVGSPDGQIVVVGADARLTAGRFGHLYLVLGRTVARNAVTVGGVIEVLNARGGPELVDRYLGPNSGGDGGLTVFGGQYDLSTTRLVYGDRFTGNSPDLMFSLFTMAAQVDSDDPAYNGVLKLKAGGELTYTMLRWLGASLRVDTVRLNGSDSKQAFNIISPRLLFHTDWQSRDEIVLQYSNFQYGSGVHPRTGYPPLPDPLANPDKHVFSLSAIFWW
jgi:hypothetical protein